jgi:hypothetical protein
LAYSHNLIQVYMECDYTHLNHNSLVSQKKSGHQGHDYKRGLLYIRSFHGKFCGARPTKSLLP